MDKLFWIVAAVCLVYYCSANSTVYSYEGFKVLRVKVGDRDAADKLHEIGDESAEFWSDLPGRHADLMIAPGLLGSVSASLDRHGFEYSTLIDNVAGEFLSSVRQTNARGRFLK
jgi:hypothetical protein